MLFVIQVGHDEASDRYIRNKKRAVEKADMQMTVVNLHESATTDQLLTAIHQVDAEPDCAAIMVQLPLPHHIDKDAVMREIPVEKDIDGLNPASRYRPLTPCAIMHWLKSIHCNLAGTNVVIFGRSDLVGKPLADMLVDEDATVTMIHTHTDPMIRSLLCRRADIVISAMGNPDVLDNIFNFFSYDGLYPTLFIDVGINRDENGKLCGDFSHTVREWIDEVDGYCTPVAGKWTVEELIFRLKEMEDQRKQDYERGVFWQEGQSDLR